MVVIKKILLVIMLSNVFFVHAEDKYKKIMADRAVTQLSAFNTMYNAKLISYEPLTLDVDVYVPENQLNSVIETVVLESAFDVVFVAFSQSDIEELHFSINVEMLKGVRFNPDDYSYSKLLSIDKRLKSFNKEFVIKKVDFFRILRANNIFISDVINKQGHPGERYHSLRSFKPGSFYPVLRNFAKP